jgi:myo-inositol-1(or 4)-monophosphatase
VPLVVDVEPVIDRLTLDVGDESCNIDYCHVPGTLPSNTVDASNADRPSLHTDVLELFARICDRTTEVVAATTDWGASGRRDGQYRVDLDTDDVCVEPLLAAGWSVLSEESGLQDPASGPSRGTVVVDPLDGSTNASLGLPWFATSLCLVVEGVAEVAMVANLATGQRYWASRGGGAWCDGQRISVAVGRPLDDSIVAVSGLPARQFGWRQFRALGAAALDLCAVASGGLDAYIDCSVDAHGPWDYLGGLLVCVAAGASGADARGRDLLVRGVGDRRTPGAGATPGLLAELLSAAGRAPGRTDE